jgi:MFS family permease
MLIDSGLHAANAAKTASLLGVSLICGRLATGIAIDRFFAPRVATILMAVSSAGFAVLAFGSSSLVPFAAVFVGISFGAEIDLVVFLVSRYFSTTVYGRIFGMLYGVVLVGPAISPALYGFLRDVSTNYVGRSRCLRCCLPSARFYLQHFQGLLHRCRKRTDNRPYRRMPN